MGPLARESMSLVLLSYDTSRLFHDGSPKRNRAQAYTGRGPMLRRMTASKTKERFKPANDYPLWAPRFWHGMLFTDWMRLMAQHRFRIHPLRWGLALGITFASTFNSKMRIAQQALQGHRISKTSVPDDPLFILGHWRSGTTLLHELLSVDERFASPTTYQCFAPNHFLLTEAVVTRLLWFLIPSKRPMDNVAMGWHEPQEDEFALCAMGLPSPYLRIAFPNEGQVHLDYLDMKLTDAELDEWKQTMCEFLRRLAVRHPDRRLVLKSPTHTGRVALLAEMFPRAKFVHITRNPYDVVPSSIRLWKSLDYVQGLQIPNNKDVEENVFRNYERMYGGFESQRAEVPRDRLVDIRFEDLVADGSQVMETIYRDLDLGDFENVRPKLEETLAAKKSYQKNKHTLPDDLVQNINERWRDYFERYGYEVRSE